MIVVHVNGTISLTCTGGGGGRRVLVVGSIASTQCNASLAWVLQYTVHLANMDLLLKDQ